METPLSGTRALCSACHQEIIFIGPYWDHIGENKPRHIASPRSDTAPSQPVIHGAWYALISPREQVTIDHALSYAEHFASAGVPGHSAHLLIAKLANELDRATVGVEGDSDAT